MAAGKCAKEKQREEDRFHRRDELWALRHARGVEAEGGGGR